MRIYKYCNLKIIQVELTPAQPFVYGSGGRYWWANQLFAVMGTYSNFMFPAATCGYMMSDIDVFGALMMGRCIR